LLRGETPRTLAAFDPVVQTLVTGQRAATTVPTQSLFLLNSSFVRRESLLLADRLLTPEYPNDGARIREAYERVLGRDPKAEETAKARTFVAQYSATWLSAHPGSPATSSAQAARAVWTPGDITAGVERWDKLTPDQEIFEVKPPAEDPSLTIIPDSAAEAGWGAFVQALYGSAEFQFVR
jgi:hypothetical protein